MKTPITLYTLMLCVLIIGCAKGNQMDVRIQPQLNSLVASLENREIGKLEILQIPPGISTRVAIIPETLEKQFHYKITIRDMRGGRYRESLLEALKSISAQPEPEMPDLRWGLLFYDLNGARVGAIYFDKWGKRGAVGDIPVSFKGKLFKWLDRNFSCCLR